MEVLALKQKKCSLVCIICVCCLFFSSCYTTYSLLPADFGEGTYSAQLLADEGIVLSTVKNNPERLEGYYDYQGQITPIYVIMDALPRGEGSEAWIYESESNVQLMYLHLTCDEDQLILYEVIDSYHNSKDTVDLFKLFASSPIVLKKHTS